MERPLLKKRYALLEEVALATGLSFSDLVHAAAQGEFPIYALADNWTVLAYKKHGEGNEWTLASTKPSHISGPIRLYRESMLRLEANPKVRINRFMGDDFNTPFAPDEDWEYRLVEGDILLADCKFAVTTDCRFFAKLFHDGQHSDPGETVSTLMDKSADEVCAPKVGKQGKAKKKEVAVQPISDLPNDSYLREWQLLQYLPFSRSTLYRMMAKGEFPSSVKVADKVSAWRVEDVRKWIAEH